MHACMHLFPLQGVYVAQVPHSYARNPVCEEEEEEEVRRRGQAPRIVGPDALMLCGRLSILHFGISILRRGISSLERRRPQAECASGRGAGGQGCVNQGGGGTVVMETR